MVVLIILAIVQLVILAIIWLVLEEMLAGQRSETDAAAQRIQRIEGQTIQAMFDVTRHAERDVVPGRAVERRR